MDWGDGAGFINDTISEDPHQVTSSVSVAAGDDKNKSIAAVSVAQVTKLTRPNDGLIVHGKKIYHLNLVAYVYEIVDINQQKIHVLVDDHTGGGPLEVSHIIGDTGTPGENPSMTTYSDTMADNDQPRDIHSLQVGDYIRCVGVVKYTQDKANLVAYALRIIEDPNEITMHIMEVIKDSKSAEKAQANGGVYPTATNVDKPTNMNMAQPDMGKVSSEFGKLSTRDKHLLTFLKSKANSENGIHMDEICKNFTAFKKQDIIDSLVLLSNEGLCWQSDAEDVWCVD